MGEACTKNQLAISRHVAMVHEAMFWPGFGAAAKPAWELDLNFFNRFYELMGLGLGNMVWIAQSWLAGSN